MAPINSVPGRSSPLGRWPLVLVAAALVAGGVTGQNRGSWAPLNLGAPIQASSIHQLGKTATYLEANRVHFFSGFTRQWQTVSITASAPVVRVFNDLACVVEPGRILAFSAYRGVVESLSVSPSAAVLNPAAQRNDSILAVRDGTTLWTFSCFRGTWVSRTLTTSSPLFTTQRHVALLAEGTSLHGLSAFEGTWVPHTAPVPAVAVSADGSWGMVETASTLHAFSGQRNTWSTATVSASATQSLKGEDCIVYWGSTQAIAYSGLRGAFATTDLVGSSSVAAEALVVTIVGPAALRLYSAVLGTWTTVPTAGPVTPSVQPQLVVWSESGATTAYSPFLGATARLPVTASTLATNQGVACTIDLLARNVWLYSTLTGNWTIAPSDVRVEQPDLIWCGALLRTSSGFSAYSGRSGRFLPVAASATASKWVDVNSSVMAVEDTSSLSVFDARREVWLSAAKASPALFVRIWRSTLLAVDGSTVLGFGSMSGEIARHTLPAAPTELAANSESVRAGVDRTLVCFGGTPDIVTLYQFPEFRRVYTLGAPLEVQMTGPAGATAWAILSLPGRTVIALPPFGDFLLDPALAAILPLGPLPGDGRGTLRLALPNQPLLRGLELGFQGFVAPTAGTPYLTRLATVGLR